MLSRAMSSFLRPLEEVARGGFKVEVKGKEIRIFSGDSVALLRRL